MMKRRGKYVNLETTTLPAVNEEEDVDCELRPGGMLVQKRGDNAEFIEKIPSLRVRVEYGPVRFHVMAIPQSTFGELKKKLTVETGLQPDEQKLSFKGKVRGDGDYLDFCGVKDRSKVVLTEDQDSKERKAVQMQLDAKIQAVNCLIDNVSAEVDRLEEQVYAIEKSIANGSKVAELQITTLIEMLMRQAVKLDSVAAQGNACAKKDLQGKRVRKCVETLDVLKISNAEVKVPVVTANKWKNLDPAPSASTQWELFE